MIRSFGQHKPSRRSAITLVEMMVVLVVLALVATMTSIRFATPLRKQRVLSALQQWRSIDFLARKASRSSDVSVSIESRSGSKVVSVQQDDRIIRSWAISSPLSLRVQATSGEEIDLIRFVRAQGSIDYQVTLSEGSTQEQIEIAGGTGKVRE
jgi:Tfp pilus assembly protein FimT